MTIVGRNFHHMNIAGQALAPQTINNTSVNGNTISEPWRHGRDLVFLLNNGAFAASASGLATIEVQQRSDDAWVALKEGDGVANMQFEPTLLDDAAAGENAVLMGTIPVSRIDSTTYKAVRLVFTSEGVQDMATSCVYIIGNLYEHVSGQVDHLFSKAMKAKTN